MAANAPLIERTDIHKSCKALEAIVNAFNDYCQAAEAIALVQKKLARALKDAVGLKATNELVANALNAAAGLLESLADIDAKFVKVIDKECESASNDVKKWFKRLAKEEKNHDEKINAANAKIKQAGLAYEKKAKRKDRDVGEEHTRYVNLLGAIGPEMSQERYNHTLFVTQRHTATLYSVVSSVSRATDAEWTRACDCVRKFAPVVGRIGECRAYLEGGWMLNVPDGSGDSEDKSTKGATAGVPEQDPDGAVDEMGVRVGKLPSGSTETDSSVHRSPAPAYASSTSLNSATPNASVPSNQSSQGPPSAPPSLPSRSHSTGPPPTCFSPVQFDRSNMDSVRSIESLSSFPAPPAHFPLPAMVQLPASQIVRPSTNDKSTPSGSGKNSEADKPASTDSPVDRTDQQTPNIPKPTAFPAEQTNPSPADNDASRSGGNDSGQLPTPAASPSSGEENLGRDVTVKIKPAERPRSPQRRGSGNLPHDTEESDALGRKLPGTVERTESVTSTNSIVASMRDKWGRGDVSSPAPPRERDIPRVSTKVSDLASRYAPATDTTTVPLSPRNDRSRQVSGASIKGDEKSSTGQTDQRTTTTSSEPGVTASELNLIRRRRRIEELEELERREQAQALRAREREIEMQTKELERERERLRALSLATAASPTTATPVRAHPQHSYSMVNLIPSYSGPGEAPVRPVSASGEPLVLTTSPSSSSSASNPPSRPDHAPYCGCQACSASQYRDSHPHVQIITQPRPQKEKSKGWMRRLSMPVVANAFSSSDSKKAYGIGAGIAGGTQAGGPPAYFESDSTGGISNVRPRKISFGRR